MFGCKILRGARRGLPTLLAVAGGRPADGNAGSSWTWRRSPLHSWPSAEPSERGGGPPSLPQKPPCDLRQHAGPSHGDRLPRGPPVLRSIRESKAELKERRWSRNGNLRAESVEGLQSPRAEGSRDSSILTRAEPGRQVLVGAPYRPPTSYLCRRSYFCSIGN